MCASNMGANQKVGRGTYSYEAKSRESLQLRIHIHAAVFSGSRITIMGFSLRGVQFHDSYVRL